MKIYLDVFFLLNMGMNFVIFMTESFFIKGCVRIRRLLAASAAGAAAACVMVVAGVHRFLPLLVILYLAVSILFVRLAFGKTTPGTLIRNILLFYITAFLLGGLLVQLQKVFQLPMTGVTVLAAASLMLLLLRWLLPRLQRTQEKLGRYYRIRLHYAGARIEGNALLDTGNCLYDPISHQPVLLGDVRFLNTLLKKEKEPVMRMIPFHSVGKDSGLIRAFQAESLEIAAGDGWKCIEKPWVALCDKYVSADGEYEIILHPDMLMEDKN